jgi:predicted ATPase
MDYSEINKIKAQFQADQWPHFLEMIEIIGLRGWTGQSINFNFPVVGIVGENGTGKSTVLKAAACAYENEVLKKTYYPSTFFMKTHWDPVHDVTLNYRIKIGDQIKQIKIRKPTQRWSIPSRRIKRPVYIFDISRTVPLDASMGYAKIAKLTVSEISSNELDPAYRERLSHIMGRNYLGARFATSDVDDKREVGLLSHEFGEVSQFHQGAGEDTALDLLRALQSIPNNSLLLIDEIEASLHPRAQRRLVRFLLWFSRQKRCQIIISTHSPYILEELPQEARVLLISGPEGLSVVYGISPEFAMSRIDEGAHPELFLFVEDRESKIWLREIIVSSQDGSDLLPRISIDAVGPANVVQILGKLSKDRKLPYKSLAILDGDAGASENCVTLPGSEAPEIVVLNDLKERNWQGLHERFGVGAGQLYSILDDTILNPDYHKWTTLIGDKILKSATSVWETLCNQWCKICLQDEQRSLVLSQINDSLA